MLINKKILVSILLGTLALVGLFGSKEGYCWSIFSKPKVEEALLAFSFFEGGGMLGDHNSIEIKKSLDGTLILSESTAKSHSHDGVVKEYLISDKVLEDLRDIFNENGMATWGKLPQSKYHVLDGATSSYDFYFEKQRVRFNSEMEFPKGAVTAIKKIFATINEHRANAILLPGLVLPSYDENDYTSRRSPIKGKIMLEVYAYRNNNLRLRIKNGLSEEFNINDSYLITKLGDEPQIIAQGKTPYRLHVNPNYSEEYSISLNKRLSVGKYAIKLDSLSGEFEIK